MIRSVIVTNDKGDVLTLNLAEPAESGFAVTDIDGISAGKATVNMTEIATRDGSVYNSARRSAREITLNLRLLWNPTIEDSRQMTYKYFPLKRKVYLTFVTDNRTVETEGYVESNETDIFQKSEACVITVICADPNLYLSLEGGKEIISFSSVESLFEFPFSNEDITEPLIIFGEIASGELRNINYIGEVPVGITIKIHAIGSASNITIFNISTGESMAISSQKLMALVENDISAGDVITINTTPGSKSITLTRNGVNTNILNCLDKNVDWFTLSPGDNIFAYTATSGVTNLQFTIEHRVAYEGV